MKDFEMRYVGSHVEVYTGSGVFLFSAAITPTAPSAAPAAMPSSIPDAP